MSDFVPESEIDYDEVYRRGGYNCGDEDFALLRCPFCAHVYMMEYEVDTVYLDGRELGKRLAVFNSSFDCLSCGRYIPVGAWAGPKAEAMFEVCVCRDFVSQLPGPAWPRSLTTVYDAQ